MMQCPSCGHLNIAGSDHCAECQADLHHAGLPESTAVGLGRQLLRDSIMELKPELRLAVGPDSSVGEVIKVMIEQQASGVMVTEDDRLVGVFTERDLLIKIADRFEQLAGRPIKEFMTSSPESLAAGDSIAFGLNQMAVKHYRHIPVVEDHKPVAMVRTKDVLRYIAEHCPEVA